MMTEIEKKFIKEMKIPEDFLFDAKGNAINTIVDEMRLSDKFFAYNTTPCQNAGHTIRDRYSHCIQCKPAHISFALRHHQYGYVYIVGSKKKQVIKIGSTSNVEKRMKYLNGDKYGNIIDWELIYYCECLNIGKIEFEIQKQLKSYTVGFYPYKKNGKDITSTEIFSCSYSKAKEKLTEYLTENKIKLHSSKEDVSKINNFNFKNLKKI